jgi:hypothetical protein
MDLDGFWNFGKAWKTDGKMDKFGWIWERRDGNGDFFAGDLSIKPWDFMGKTFNHQFWDFRKSFDGEFNTTEHINNG